jgi:hypothetical protein
MKARSPSAILILALGFASTCQPAFADSFNFKTPSDNIYCAYDDYNGTAEVRCDIRDYTSTMGKMPADCDLDWGDSFVIAASDRRGSVLCHGDTVISEQAKTLGYGNVWKDNGITCMSQESGLTCINRKGHGFSLSKKEQRVF